MQKGINDESYKRLTHILEAINGIIEFSEGLDELSFIANHMANRAILYNFSIIGEAIIHVDESILEKYEYPWYKVRAFRNFITHVYFLVKLEKVWEIIQNEIPGLKALVEEILIKEF